MSSRKTVTRRVLRAGLGIASAGALALTVAAASATVAVDKLQDNIVAVDISDQIGPRPTDDRPVIETPTGPLNILMMGSDKRTGKGNGGYGYFDGERSDTTMLLHIYPDRRSAVVISIPRDTITTIPSCTMANGQRTYPYRERFNSAYSIGGPGCTVKTVEKMSGLQIDHFVVLDFNGFKRAINALGGVEVCLTRPVDDPSSNIHLPKGRSRISGDEALDFVRVRHGIGDGSDISRIDRQQLFLTSMIQEITGSGMVTDPIRLWNFLDESTKSLTTDKGLARKRGVLDLARSMAFIEPADIAFVTLPWYGNDDGSTVSEDTRRSGPMWEAIADEEPWPPKASVAADGKRLTVRQSEVTVAVRNATGRDGMGTRVADKLANQGFNAYAVDKVERATQTVIRFGPGQRGKARTLQAALPGSKLDRDPDASGALEVTLGSDYDRVKTLTVRPPRDPDNNRPDDGVTTADDNICVG